MWPYNNSGGSASGSYGGNTSFASFAGQSSMPQDAEVTRLLGNYEREIQGLTNRGVEGRMEDALVNAGNAAAQTVARTGLDPNSMQAALVGNQAQIQASDAAWRREADIYGQMQQARAGMYGNLAQSYMGWQGQKFGQQMQTAQYQMQLRQLDFQERQAARSSALADAQLFLQQISNPTWAAMAGIFNGGYNGAFPMVGQNGINWGNAVNNPVDTSGLRNRGM